MPHYENNGQLSRLALAAASSNSLRGAALNEHPGLIKLLAEPNAMDAGALSESAMTTFTLFEPWYKADKSFTNSHVVNLVKKVVCQADNYRSAISTSVDTAENGCGFANDALLLCRKLADRDEPTHLAAFVDSMYQIAQESHQAADQTNRKFRSIRVEIAKISTEIPTVKTAVGDPNSKVLSVPVRLSPMSWLLGSSRRTEKKSLDEILMELERLQQLLEESMGHVTHFVNWWGSLSRELKALKAAIPTIAIDGSNPIRMETTQEQWKEVHRQYGTYVDKMTLIEDYYHRPISFWSKLIGRRRNSQKLILAAPGG